MGKKNTKSLKGVRVANVTLKNIHNKKSKNFQKKKSVKPQGSVIEKLQKRRKSLTQKGVQQVMIKKQKPRVYVKSMNNRKISPLVSMKYRNPY